VLLPDQSKHDWLDTSAFVGSRQDLCELPLFEGEWPDGIARTALPTGNIAHSLPALCALKARWELRYCQLI